MFGYGPSSSDAGGPPPLPAQPQSSLSFTQGFLLGQLSIVLLIGAFIKYFIFDPPTPPPSSSSTPLTSTSPLLSPHHNKRRPSTANTNTRSPIPTILTKTYYNPLTHAPESLDWFNVLTAQAISQLRLEALSSGDDSLLPRLSGALNGPQRPDYVGPIKVSDVSLGDEFPIFSNCRIVPSSAHGSDGLGGDAGKLEARMDVDLTDALTLGVETSLLLNYPRARAAVLPVALAVSVVRFSGTLCVSFVPSPSPPPSPSNPTRNPPAPPSTATETAPRHPSTSLTFSFTPGYTLELTTHSLIGSRSRLQDVPKIAQLVEARVRAWFEDRCVAPRQQVVGIPNLWPRSARTRGGEELVLDKERPTSRGVDVADRDLGPSAGLERRLDAVAGRAGLGEWTAGPARSEGEGLRWRGGLDGLESGTGGLSGLAVS
ncbi:MAG: ERMES complex subunit mmm1 [Vezdaea acicularis]|nr:MAG: ERMES complex subunit mmm1 [Vezdaea acicularis]